MWAGKAYRYGMGFVEFTSTMPSDVSNQITVVEDCGAFRKLGGFNVIWSGDIPYRKGFMSPLMNECPGTRLEAHFFGACYAWDGCYLDHKNTIEQFLIKELAIYIPKRCEFYHIKKGKFKVLDPEKLKRYGDIEEKLINLRSNNA